TCGRSTASSTSAHARRRRASRWSTGCCDEFYADASDEAVCVVLWMCGPGKDPNVRDAGIDFVPRIPNQESPSMYRRIHHTLHLVFILGLLALATALPASAHDTREQVTLADDPTSCIVDVKGEVLGSTPSEIEGYSLVSARVTFAPGGTL